MDKFNETFSRLWESGDLVRLDEESKLNCATVPLDKARKYAEGEFSTAGKNLDKELPDFDKNYMKLQKACKKAKDVPRGDMPVIEPEDMGEFERRLKDGKIDIFKPFAKGKLYVPKDMSKSEGEEWVELGVKDGDPKDDIMPAKMTTIPGTKLYPTQSEIWLNKLIKNILKWGKPSASSPVVKTTIITSKEGYILDGHHRYGQVMLVDPKLKMRALWIPLSIEDLLKIGVSYGSAIGRKRKAGLESYDNLSDLTESFPKGVITKVAKAVEKNGGRFSELTPKLEALGLKVTPMGPFGVQVAYPSYIMVEAGGKTLYIMERKAVAGSSVFPGKPIKVVGNVAMGIQESHDISEGFSKEDISQIKSAVEDNNGKLIGVGAILKKLGFKSTFMNEPPAPPMILITGKGKAKFVLVNKKYADKPDFVVGAVAGGLAEDVSLPRNPVGEVIGELADSGYTDAEILQELETQFEIPRSKGMSMIKSSRLLGLLG